MEGGNFIQQVVKVPVIRILEYVYVFFHTSHHKTARSCVVLYFKYFHKKYKTNVTFFISKGLQYK